ncbi:MAG: phage major capsid protein [Methanogenium sp.]
MLEQIKDMLAQYKDDIMKGYDSSKEEVMNQITLMETRVKEIEDRFTALSSKMTVPGLDAEKQEFSFFKAIWAIKNNDWSNAGFEKEVFDNTRKKAQSMGTSSAGGYIVPTIYVPDIIELLVAESVVASMGATMLPALQGSPVQIPRQSAGSTAYWVGENQSITESSITLEQINLTPKKVAALVKLSNTLIRLSNPSAEALVRMDIARSLALKIDLTALRGTGSNNQPTGIVYTSGIGTEAIGDNGGSLTFDHLINMEYTLASENALRGKLGFIWHPCIRRNLIKRRYPNYSGQTDGPYIISPITESEFKLWVNYPYAQTTQIPINLTKAEGTALTEVYFGNWADLLIGQWGGMEIMASQETSDAFEKDQTWVRILQELDIAVRHPKSFVLCSDASSSS